MIICVYSHFLLLHDNLNLQFPEGKEAIYKLQNNVTDGHFHLNIILMQNSVITWTQKTHKEQEQNFNFVF